MVHSSGPGLPQSQGMIKGVELLPPHSHPEGQPVPGPTGTVPANWERS
jgi:hypothetical protein